MAANFTLRVSMKLSESFTLMGGTSHRPRAVGSIRGDTGERSDRSREPDGARCARFRAPNARSVGKFYVSGFHEAVGKLYTDGGAHPTVHLQQAVFVAIPVSGRTEAENLMERNVRVFGRPMRGASANFTLRVSALPYVFEIAEFSILA